MSRGSLRLAGLAVVGIALAAGAVVLLAGGLRVLHAQSDLPRVPHIDGAPLRSRLELTSPHLAQQATDRPGAFPFQTAGSSDGLIVVHYYYRSASYGDGFVSAAQQAVLSRVQPRLGYGLKSPVNIYVYNSRGDFLAGVQPSNPAITGAITYFHTSEVYLADYYGSDVTSVLAHELTHVVFHQHADMGHLDLDYRLYPNWLDEGLAESDIPENGVYANYDNALLRQALSNGSFRDIFSIFQWTYPSDPDTDNLCYAEARDFIRYIAGTYGPAQFHGFVDDLRDGDIVFAAEANFGVDLETLRNGWRASLGLAALPHSPGAQPSAAPLIPYNPQRLQGLAAQTTPFAVDGGDEQIGAASLDSGLAAAVVALAIALPALWSRLRRRRSRAGATSTPSPPESYAASGSITQESTASTSLLGGPVEHPAEHAKKAVAAEPTSRVLTIAQPTAQPNAGAPLPLKWLRYLREQWEPLALLLCVPVTTALALLWTRLDPAQSWQHEYDIGAAIAALCAVGAGILAWRARRSRRSPLAHAVTVLALLAVAGLAIVHAGPAGVVQGKAYEDAGAYALAFEALSAASAAKAELARVQTEWAQAANGQQDYAAATRHFRAAAALAPSAAAAQSSLAALLAVTHDWAGHLLGAHKYDEAAHVFLAQLDARGCDQSCQATLKESAGSSYLDWASDLIVTHHVDDGIARLHSLTQQLPGTQAATTATLVIAHRADGLAAAASAGKAGDATAMDLLLKLIAVQHPDSVDAEAAAHVSQPVSGDLDRSYLYKTPIYIFLIAFNSDADAQAFIGHIYTDTSLFKVITRTDAQGHFTTRLPAGYTYLPLWEVPSQDGRDGWFHYSRRTFDVTAFTPPTLVRLGA